MDVMAIMLAKLNEALLAAGVPADKAQAAAEEGAAYENRIAGAETKLAVLTWMVGANIGLTLLVLGSAFALWSKLGDLSAQIARMSH